MSEIANPFVKYLNSLHNYNAQNSNAYGEKNIDSPYYQKTMVDIAVCDHIINSLTNADPHILVLTGHAGDGKTSLMYQVLSKLGQTPDFSKPVLEITLENEKTCCCIKDFSELSDDKKLEMMKKIVTYPVQGKYVFMVANTGPLINTFGELFSDPNDQERAKMELIGAMDENVGDIIDIEQIPFLVINVAAIDNTSFPTKFLNKLIQDEFWNSCSTCDKKEYCHIYKNRTLINNNKDRVFDFISKYYIWETEYGHRLTIRSMTEHLAYMITGGTDCDNIIPVEIHKSLFFNLFFGYYGSVENHQANQLLAIRLAQKNHFDAKRLRADEDLIIRRNYNSVFSDETTEIITRMDIGYSDSPAWIKELRRMYFFLNIVPDDIWRRDTEDIFSKQYTEYLDVRNGNKKPTKNQKTLIIDALKMMYLGTVVSNSNSIPITLSKEGAVLQSVQLVVGELNTSDIDLVAEEDSNMNSGEKNLFLRINRKEKILLTLPMVDYFEELRNGVISTTIDPQLSHGIENLKAQLLKVVFTDSDDLEMIVLNNSGYDKKSLYFEDNKLRLN